MNEPEQEEVGEDKRVGRGCLVYVLYIETKPPLTVRRNKTNDYYNQTATVSVLGGCMQEYIGTKGDWQAGSQTTPRQKLSPLVIKSREQSSSITTN